MSVGQGISLKALIDPKDVERKPKSPTVAVPTMRRRRNSIHIILRKLFRLAGKGDGTLTRRPSTYHDPILEAEQNRRSRQVFLEQRKARGSIMYENGESVL